MGACGWIEISDFCRYSGAMRSSPDHENWIVIALAAFGLTAVVFLFAKAKSPLEKTQACHIVWIFVGIFAAIAIGVGLVDMVANGYGDGELF